MLAKRLRRLAKWLVRGDFYSIIIIESAVNAKVYQFVFKLFFTAYGEQLTISVISVSSSASCNFNGAISLSVTLQKKKKNQNKKDNWTNIKME